jgi:flagellar biosynthesis anti-sigma factor FlgM
MPDRYLNCKAIQDEESIMRIEFNRVPQPAEASPTSAATPSVASTQSASHTEALGEDQAQLSGTHAQVEALTAQAGQLPEVRQEKVQALRQAVEAGRYHASPETVAGALLADVVAVPAA